MMNTYQEPILNIILLAADIVATSVTESADDLGQWNGDWFPKNSGGDK